MTAHRQEFKQMADQALVEKIVGLRHELLGARLAAASGQLKDISQIRKIRKNIACALTILSQRKQATK